MLLKDFIDKFMSGDKLVRLWYSDNGVRKMITKQDNDVCNVNDLLDDKVWQSEYKDSNVLGISGILIDKSFSKDVTNIVVEKI